MIKVVHILMVLIFARSVHLAKYKRSGKSTCTPCTISEEGTKLTSNHNHTECIIDLYALRRPIIDVVFEDGIAVSVSFFVAICYSLSLHLCNTVLEKIAIK